MGKQTKQAVNSKTVINTPPWSLHQHLPPGSCPGFLQWWRAAKECKPQKPFPPDLPPLQASCWPLHARAGLGFTEIMPFTCWDYTCEPHAQLEVGFWKSEATHCKAGVEQSKNHFCVNHRNFKFLPQSYRSDCRFSGRSYDMTAMIRSYDMREIESPRAHSFTSSWVMASITTNLSSSPKWAMKSAPRMRNSSCQWWLQYVLFWNVLN